MEKASGPATPPRWRRPRIIRPIYAGIAERSMNTRFSNRSATAGHSGGMSNHRGLDHAHPTVPQLALAITQVLAATTATATASARDELVTEYATTASREAPAFAGFAAARGESFHRKSFAGGNPDREWQTARTKANCRACHADAERGVSTTIRRARSIRPCPPPAAC